MLTLVTKQEKEKLALALALSNIGYFLLPDEIAVAAKPGLKMAVQAAWEASEKYPDFGYDDMALNLSTLMAKLEGKI
jgi:hypothetical protein